MILHNDFLGLNEPNVILPFLSGDTKERYEENLKVASDDWYYRNIGINYHLNENGHRSKSLQDLNQSNYILYTGCSHTTGIGLELEKSYPYIVSTNLGCDYYNISIPGVGIDVLEYNLLTWFSKIHQKPKVVVIQMPDHTRYCTHNTYISTKFFVETGAWTKDESELKLLVNSDDVGFFNARKHFTYENLKNVIDVPIILFNVDGQNNVNDGLKMRKRDLARDLKHFGIKSNAELAVDMTNHIKSILNKY